MPPPATPLSGKEVICLSIVGADEKGPAPGKPHKKTLYQDDMPNGDIFDGPFFSSFRLEIKKEEGQADRFLWHGPQREIIEYFLAAENTPEEAESAGVLFFVKENLSVMENRRMSYCESEPENVSRNCV